MADSIFVTTLYANESDMVMRYTDQGQMTEVCKWTVDLAKLPTFVENAKAHRSGGFYTGNVLRSFSSDSL